MADLQRGSLSGRFPWWLGGIVIGALLGGLFASLGGIVLGIAFVLPFAAARGRAGAAIAGALLGAGLAGVVHGISLDLNTAAAALTLAAGLFLSGVALTKT
jgi:hypothetical protein